ncbi:carboxypeptidase D [Cladophialophora psammophila CBS 110553]|uniref:Carboxypeptidase n=1 Tax=Cladophialophora psammophila CBS 110553 TaxID=1182543 RepID=W9XAJ3_9EURO|nr:carboxypeptidase D [Cladophialophora psammophila CBS 110553]EXJ73921.1 carboxypeptidase D [Cladophialophora psammophila CBS 110553]
MLAVPTLLLLGASLSWCQFPPRPENTTILQSRFDEGVYLSYKEPHICETTPGAKSYSGYVHLPAGALGDLGEKQDYPINTFFWFFEARKNPQNAPLAIWLSGGPVSSSMYGLFVENGPCHVNPDSNSTTLNPWSWNNEVNMLYIDQPLQIGFSYDILQNITLDLPSGNVSLLSDQGSIPEQNMTTMIGTFSSKNSNNTAFGSPSGARALWHFAQTWFQEFPRYRPKDNRVSVATESYGGRYGPLYAAFFEEQNQKIRNGTWTAGDTSYIINLDTLLIINGCIERQVMWPSYPHIAFNNTYGIKTVNESIYNRMNAAYYGEDGCRNRIKRCYNLSREYDPTQRALNSSVNAICAESEEYCTNNLRDAWVEISGRSWWDFATFDPDPFPPNFYIGYLNQPHIQSALGVPLNFTPSNAVVGDAPGLPAYQPETAYRIFRRAVFDRDISTGKINTAKNATYSMPPDGPSDTWHIKNQDPPDPKWVCYTLDMEETCTKEQIEKLVSGVEDFDVQDWVLVDKNNSSLFPGIAT